jgi:hypothetical protein
MDVHPRGIEYGKQHDWINRITMKNYRIKVRKISSIGHPSICRSLDTKSESLMGSVGRSYIKRVCHIDRLIEKGLIYRVNSIGERRAHPIMTMSQIAGSRIETKRGLGHLCPVPVNALEQLQLLTNGIYPSSWSSRCF